MYGSPILSYMALLSQVGNAALPPDDSSPYGGLKLSVPSWSGSADCTMLSPHVHQLSCPFTK